MNLVGWMKNRFNRGGSNNRIYFVSNFEINEDDYDLYVENAKKKNSEENLNIDIIYGKKHTNIIKTAKYEVYSFIPQVMFFQFLRLGNLYFLSISILQLIPEITDSHGMPTYLIPLFFIIVVAMIKEFFEDLQRHKSDNEENNKKTMVFENGILIEKTWAHIKDGDVVKIFADEYFPADLVLLNCSNKKGIVNIETKNVDGESNIKHKFCLPQISKYFEDDLCAGFCRMELISESPNDNIFEYTGEAFLPPLQYKKEGKLIRFYNESDEDIFTAVKKKNRNKTMQILSRTNKVKMANRIKQSASDIVRKMSVNLFSNMNTNFGNTLKLLKNSEHGEDENEGEDEKEETEKEKAKEKERSEKIKGKDEKDSSFQNIEENSHISKKTMKLIHMLPKTKKNFKIPINIEMKQKKANAKTVPICIDNMVLRGTSLVNTKWVYGLVINTGNRTKLMKNVSAKSRQKWSRLEYVYSNHVIVLIIIQIFISIFVAIGGVLWMTHTGHNLWYLHAEQQFGTIKTFFVTIGAMILLFGSFIPVDLLLIWEVVRLMQGYLINWDDEMYSKKTGRHALSKAGQLLEEMGNVTHIYSDKTGTLTQNVMQLQNIGLGNNGVYGFYDFSNKEYLGKIKSNKTSVFLDNDLEKIYTEDKLKSVKIEINHNITEDHEDYENQGHASLKKITSHLLPHVQVKENINRKESSSVTLIHAKTSHEKKKGKCLSRSRSVGSDTYEQIYTEADFVRGENEFVFFNRVLFANKIHHNHCASEQALYCLLVCSLCHSALIRNAEIDEMEEPEQTERETEKEQEETNTKHGKENTNGKRNRSLDEKKKELHKRKGTSITDEKYVIKKRKPSSEELGKRKIFDKESGLYYTYLTDPQPQYDAGSPDEMALICTSLYLGCEFTNRPDLRTIEIELTSTFAQRLILGETVFQKYINRKTYYENNFYQFFPEVIEMEKRKERSKKQFEDDKACNEKGITNLSVIVPLKNIFDYNKHTDEGEKLHDETTKIIKNRVSKNESNKNEINKNESSKNESNKNKNANNKNKSGNNNSINDIKHGPSALKILNTDFSNADSKGKDHKENIIIPILSFEILDVFAFDNIRKRMSIIVKNEQNEIYMLTKGADASVLKMAKENQETLLSHLQYQLTTFANSGLRTLVLGYKHLSLEDFQKIHIRHIKVRGATSENKETILQNFYDSAEKDLIIIGCTGIDDKLQDDVPQIIEELKEAGITICVLTGDKLETAINIGHSINILNKDTYNAVFVDTEPDMLLEQINAHEKNTNAANLANFDRGSKWWASVKWENLSLDIKSDTLFDFMKTYFNFTIENHSETNKIIQDKKESFCSMLKQEKLMNSFIDSDAGSSILPDNNKKHKTSENIRHYSQFAITVTGEALSTITRNKLLKIKFYTLARSASTLIACRVTPKQKALLVKENSAFNPKGTSLAIGDGANDVGMILMANVGVGIAGKEGLQAARSSDFTISEFKYLKKLLFVHGRESLRRNSFLVYFCIFRNVSFCLCSMVLIFLTGYSTIDAWNSWTKQIINIAFTSLPVIVFVALDKQLPHHVLLNNPVLYETTPSTLWPIYSHKRMEHYSLKITGGCKMFGRLICYPFHIIPFFQKISDSVKSFIGKRSKPEKFRSYGTHFLVIYVLYAIWLAVIETLLILFFATGQAHSAYKQFYSIDIDFNTFSQILYTHHAIAVNAVVVILSNTWFVIFHVVLILEVVALFLFWLVISKWHLFLDIVGAEDLHGTFENAHGSTNYYAALFMSLYVSLLPLLLLCTYQYMKKPTMEQIVAEQLRLGIFEGLRKQTIKKLAYVDDTDVGKNYINYGFAFAMEAKDAFLGIVQKAIDKIKHHTEKK